MFKQLLSVFLESRCQFCPRTNANVLGISLCEHCYQKLSSHQLSTSDRHKLYQTQSIYAWGRYDGQLKRAIARMKYQNQPEIGSLLGAELGKAWIASGLLKRSPKVAVVPIPMHQQKQQERGFNQAAIIAHEFCRVTGYYSNTRTLVRIKATEAMFNLGSTLARAKNLQGAFKIDNKLPQHPVLLIDDIHTTGTTVKEAVRVLQDRGVKVIGVAVVAKAGWDIEH
ncbi:MAG: ComF family protein [Cyanobacteria bacterium P01_C01_bin.72]